MLLIFNVLSFVLKSGAFLGVAKRKSWRVMVTKESQESKNFKYFSHFYDFYHKNVFVFKLFY